MKKGHESRYNSDRPHKRIHKRKDDYPDKKSNKLKNFKPSYQQERHLEDYYGKPYEENAEQNQRMDVINEGDSD